MMMGFSEALAIKGLENCSGNIERATDWIFSHMDEPETNKKESNITGDEDFYLYMGNDKPPFYRLKAFVTHLGANVGTGH